MGHRMSDVPHIYEDECPQWPAPSETPKYVYARFSNIIKCPDPFPGRFRYPPNDHEFKLTQHAVSPCLWTYLGEVWYIEFAIFDDPLRAYLILGDWTVWDTYFQATEEGAVDEGTVYNNVLTDCLFGRAAHHGIATVTWTQEATNLLESINMQRADDLFMEMRPLVDGNKVYKFCRKKDATNISIEFEPD